MDDLVTARLVLHPMSVEEAQRVAAGEPGGGDRWAPGYPAAGDAVGAVHYLDLCAKGGDPQPFGAYERAGETPPRRSGPCWRSPTRAASPG